MNNQLRSTIIEKQVVDFRNRFGLSSTEAIQIKSLLLKLQVLTLYRPLSESFSGMSIKDSLGNRFMLVNSNDPIGRQHFTIAHELYHLFVEENPVPHICTKDGAKDESEKCADKFASLLLMPSDAIMQMLPEKELMQESINVGTIVRLEHYFAVSRLALLNRLSDLGMLDKNKKEEIKQIPPIRSARAYGYDTALYRGGNAGLVIGSLGEKARLLFEKGRISEGHYIEVLNKLNFYENED